MTCSSRAFRNVTACVLVLCCLGGAAWFLVPEGRIPVVDEARNAVREMTGADAENGAPKSSPSKENGDGSDASAQNGGAAPEVTASLSDDPRPVPIDPQAELLARVDRAMAQPATAAADGDSTSGPVEDRPPLPDEGRKDSVVTPRFVSDMAAWLASGYVPSHHEGRSGRTSVTLIQANFRYSNSGTLRSVERDPLKSRSSILNYAFTPGMLEVLYQMYSPSFLEEMERAARESRRRTLSDAQVADMFDVYADRFRRLAVSLDAAASVDLPALSGAIRREAAHEAEANDNFARAYMALSLARESGNRDEVAIQSRRMAESTRVAGMYAERQERARNDMAYAIQRKAEGKALSSSELLFLGEWLSRRNCSVEAVKAAADVCRRMAEQMHDRADEILHRRSDGTQNASSSQAAASAAEMQATSGKGTSDAKNSVSRAGQASSPASAAVSKEQSPVSSPVSSGSGKSSSKPSSGKAFPEVSGSLNFSPASSETSVSGESSAPRPASSEGAKSSEGPAPSVKPDAETSASAPATMPAMSSESPAEASPEDSSSPQPSASATPAVPSVSASKATEEKAASAVSETALAAPEAGAAPSGPATAPAIPAAASESASAGSSEVPAGTSQKVSSSPQPSASATPSAPSASGAASKDAPAQL